MVLVYMLEASNGQVQWETIVDEYRTTRVLWVATTVLLLYEYSITFSSEIKVVWGRKLTGTSLLFILNRYLPLLNRAVTFAQMVLLQSHSVTPLFGNDNNDPVYSRSDLAVLWLEQFFVFAMLSVISLIASMRVYAIWGRDKRAFLVVLVVALIAPVVNLYLASRKASWIIETHTDVLYRESTSSGYKTLSFVGRISAILSELLVLFLTWRKTFRIFDEATKLKFKAKLPMLLLRDGTTYFLGMLLLNLISVAFISEDGDNVLTDFTVGVSTVLMSRFILNLHEVYMPTTSMVTTIPRSEHSTFVSRLRFTSVSVGTFGAPIVSMYTNHEESLHDTDSMYIEGLSVEEMPWILGSVCISDDPMTVGLEDDM